MVSLNYTPVNHRRRADISIDGFDRDLSHGGPIRRIVAFPAGIAAGTDLLWGDNSTDADRRRLARRGATFAEREETTQNPKRTVPFSKTTDNHQEPKKEDSQDAVRRPVSETRRRYDIKHAVVRMLRRGLDDNERSHSVCGCGTAAYDRDEDDGVRLQIPVHLKDENGESRAWVSGVYRCKSGWLCPTCAPSVARKRQDAVQQVVEKTLSLNGVFLMGLLTVRHTSKDGLADLKAIVTESFAAARRQKNWDRASKAAGVAGVLIAPEVTHGKHGWHFHIHFGISCTPCCESDEISDAESEALEELALAAGNILVSNYRAQVAKRGGKTVNDAQGIEVAISGERAADYIAKGVSWELTGGSAHKDGAKGRAIWQIVEDADLGVIEDFVLFCEYAEAMPGTRSCIITPSLRKKLGLPAANEEDTGEQQLEDGGKLVGELDTFTWKRLLQAKMAGTFLSWIESIPFEMTSDCFETVVDAANAHADQKLGFVTMKRAAKILKSASDEATGVAAAKAMLARDVAYRVRNAPATGKVYEVIDRRIEFLRAEGHTEETLPTSSEVVKEIARLGCEAVKRMDVGAA